MANILPKKEGLTEALLVLPLFSDYNKKELGGILESYSIIMKTYEKDQIIHIQHEVCSTMDIILEGKVMVQKIDESGNVLTIDTFINGDLLGANLLFSNKNVYPMTVSASAKTVILMLSKDLVLELCRQSTTFMEALLTEISNKTLILTEKINIISHKTIRKSVLDFLKQEQYKQGSNVIKLPLSKKELAERLGVSRSSLGRELIKMRKDGLVDYDAWTITLKKNNP